MPELILAADARLVFSPLSTLPQRQTSSGSGILLQAIKILFGEAMLHGLARSDVRQRRQDARAPSAKLSRPVKSGMIAPDDAGGRCRVIPDVRNMHDLFFRPTLIRMDYWPRSLFADNDAEHEGAQVRGMVACRYCDLLQTEVDLGQRCDAHCVRCNGVLYRGGRIQLDTLIALASAGALLFLVSNLFPIAELGTQGINRSTTLIGSSLALYDQGRWLVAALVLVTTVLFPGLQLAGLLYALVPLRMGRVPRGISWVFRMLVGLNPWSMMEVFLLGALVTLIKLADVATVLPGLALWTFGGMIVLEALVSCFFSARDFWGWVESVHPEQSSLNHA